jgi:Asp-tRNA(Asn)/Glu-tRNA(Gln) amidotransferase A subunit family amidase
MPSPDPNESGTLKEVVCLDTAGPVFLILGAPVICELWMMGITDGMCISNEAPKPGAGGSASGSASSVAFPTCPYDGGP